MNPKELFNLILSHWKTGNKISIEIFCDDLIVRVKRSGKIEKILPLSFIRSDNENLDGVKGYKSSGYNSLSEDAPSKIIDSQFSKAKKLDSSDKELIYNLALELSNPDSSKFFQYKSSYATYDRVIDYNNNYVIYNEKNIPILMLDRGGKVLFAIKSKRKSTI